MYPWLAWNSRVAEDDLEFLTLLLPIAGLPYLALNLGFSSFPLCVLTEPAQLLETLSFS